MRSSLNFFIAPLLLLVACSTAPSPKSKLPTYNICPFKRTHPLDKPLPAFSVEELPGWTLKAQPKQCGADVAFHLASNGRDNYLLFSLRHSGKKPLIAIFDQTQFVFDGKDIQTPPWPSPAPNVGLKPNKMNYDSLPFNAKSDFEGRQSVEFKLPFVAGTDGRPCVLTALFTKDP